MKWLGLAIVACVLAFFAPAFAQTPVPPASPSTSAEPVIEITVGPSPATPSNTPNALSASPSPSPTNEPTSRSFRRKRSQVSPTPLPPATPIVTAVPLATETPSPSPTPSSAPSPTFKPIFYHGFPIYPKPGFGLPTSAVPMVPSASTTGPSPAPLPTAVREKYYWNVSTPAIVLPRETVTTPVPVPQPTRSFTPHPPVLAPATDDATLDRSSSLIGGRWSCLSFAGTKLYHRYMRGDDAMSFDVATTFVLPNNKFAKAREVYRFLHGSLLWRAKLNDGLIIANAPPWIGLTWTFTGTARGDDHRPIGFRMIYTYLGQNVFRRDFERLDDVGSWSVYAGETCRRAAV